MRRVRGVLAGLVVSLVTGPALADAAPAPLLAPDDTIIFVRDGDLFSVRADGVGVRNLTNSTDRESRPCASPDGTAIAYEVYDSERAEFDIWLSAADGGAATRLLPLGRNPSWSPDAGRLVFAAQQRNTGLDIWLCNRHGKELLRITDTSENDFLPCWSPDGTNLAFVREETVAGGKEYLIIVRDATGAEDEVLRLSDRRITSLVWSPQPELLLGAKEAAGVLERLYRLNPADRRLEDVTRGPDEEIFGLWTFGRPGLLYTERRAGHTRISLRELDGSGRELPGLNDGDSEAALLPGTSRRAPHIYVFGHRSFYLPTPLLAGEDVLIPEGDLVGQLGAKIESEPNRVTLRREGKVVVLDLLTNEITAGEETRLLGIKCETVAGVLMLPLRAVAEGLGLRSEWRPESRIVRVG